MKEYGIIIKKDSRKTIIKNNDGEIFPYGIVKGIELYDRVYYERDRKHINYIRKIIDDDKKGKIIYTTQTGGYIQSNKGDILEYKGNTDCCIGEMVKYRLSDNITGERDFALVEITDIISEYNYNSYNIGELKKKIYGNFGYGEVPIKDMLAFLNKCGIYYSRNKKYDFLENFSEIFKIRYDNNSVLIYNNKDIEEEVKTSRDIIKKMGYKHFTKLQENAVYDPDFWGNNRIIVRGTTSSGKTMVPIIKYLSKREKTGEKLNMLYIVPYRALAHQLYTSFSSKLKDYNLNITYSTSEKTSMDDDIKNGDVDIAVIIYEKVLIFLSENENLFKKYNCIVFDEIGIIQEKERGIKTELVLLKSLENSHLDITLLTTPYIDWTTYQKQYGFSAIQCYNRPVKITEFFFKPEEFITPNGRKSKKYYLYDNTDTHLGIGKTNSFDYTLTSLCQTEYAKNKKVISFCFSKRASRQNASKVYSKLKKLFGWRSLTNKESEEFRNRFFKHYGLTKEELQGVFDKPEEFEALYHGITFHNASLPESMRIAIESEFLEEPAIIENGIRLVFATETLAYGLNSNVDTVIMTHMKKYQIGDEDVISYNLYQNCIGRAGRLGYLESGTSYSFFSDEDVSVSRYKWNPEDKGTLVAGDLMNTLKMPTIDKLAFCVLNLMSVSVPMSCSDIADKFEKVYSSEGREGLYEKIAQGSFDFLKKEKFIKKYIDVFDNDNGKYILSAKGKKVKGYMILAESYTSLRDGIINNEKEELSIFDILVELAKCSEIKAFCQNLIKRPAEKKMTYIEVPESYDIDYNDEITDLNAFLDMVDIITDDECLSAEYNLGMIVNSEVYQKALYITEHVEELTNEELYDKLMSIDYDTLTYFIIIIYSVFWINGFSLGLLNDISDNIMNMSNPIDNIKSKFGDKMSYLTDVIKALTTDKTVAEMLNQLSISLFYGIRIDWIRKNNICSIDPETARNYYLASIYSKKMEKADMIISEENRKEFIRDYDNLDRAIKKIIENEVN